MSISEVVNVTQSADLARVVTAAANATATSFQSRIPTTTEPTVGDSSTSGTVGGGIIRVGGGEKFVPNNLLIVPFGTGSDTNTFKMRLLGWKATKGGLATRLWVPIPLVEYTCTVTTAVGIAAKYLVATDRFCDTLSLASGYNANVSTELITPTGDIIASLVVDVKGFDLLEFQFDRNSSATSCNALYCPY